jgi:neutral ceramidase
VTAGITGRVASVVQRRHGIRRADLLFNASHTHCGPVVDEQLSVAYDLSPEQWDALRAYTSALEDNLATVIGDAVSRLRPAQLSYGQDKALFAANRRVKFTPVGPVDHSVPVLRVDAPDGSPLAIVFGYACHNTTLQDTFVQYHGDYAGVAQAQLEQRHPGATALFVAGCGADANPMPRGTLELVQAHGTALADAVDRALEATAPIEPSLRTAYGHVDLPFARDGAREQWRRQLDVEEIYKQRHAEMMRKIVARDGRLPVAQPDPVQVWRFGSGLTLVALGGEVVVDYALRLSREYPKRRMWVAGYSNDVFGYVPSLRVLREGGYEGGDAMIYYGRPGPFTTGVETLIVREVHRLIGARG